MMSAPRATRMAGWVQCAVRNAAPRAAGANGGARQRSAMSMAAAWRVQRRADADATGVVADAVRADVTAARITPAGFRVMRRGVPDAAAVVVGGVAMGIADADAAGGHPDGMGDERRSKETVAAVDAAAGRDLRQRR